MDMASLTINNLSMFLLFSYHLVKPYLVPGCLALYRVEPMEKVNIMEAQNKGIQALYQC